MSQLGLILVRRQCEHSENLLDQLEFIDVHCSSASLRKTYAFPFK